MTTINVSIHVSPDDEAKIFKHRDEAGRKYIVLSIGSIGNANIFINNSVKALEIASLLESAAKNWEDEE